jgi:hypothetical protein
MNNEHAGDQHGPPHVQIQVQTPRGLWSMTEPVNAERRPEYPTSAKVQQVIDDARAVFKFVENDSKYTLFLGQEELKPERTVASYQIKTGTLLVLSVQGGNA